MNKKKIINGKLITPHGIIENGCVIIRDGIIADVLPTEQKTDDYEVIDAKGSYVSPGFIDIHTHGGGGHDFMDGTVEAYLGAAEAHAKHGTTAMLPTTLACAEEELFKTFEVYETASRLNHSGSQFLGIHLEGPYFAMNHKGAQDPKFIKNPCKEDYMKLLNSTDAIKRWSAAPELDGALEFADVLSQKGILASVAHTDALYEDVLKAFDHGFTHATHLYSCMSTVQRINAKRYAGVVESVYLIEDMTAEMIADGVHLPASLLQLAYNIKGADKLVLITDSMRGAGMPEGESILGSLSNGQKVIIEDGVAKLMDRSAFAGSVATADRLVKNMVELTTAPLVDAIKMITATPARIMGLDSKGNLSKGKDADIVLLDKDISVQMTIIGGNIVYSRTSD